MSGAGIVDIGYAVAQEQGRLRDMLSEWMSQQRQQQDHFINSLMKVHGETLQELQQLAKVELRKVPKSFRESYELTGSSVAPKNLSSSPQKQQKEETLGEEPTPVRNFIPSTSQGAAKPFPPLNKAKGQRDLALFVGEGEGSVEPLLVADDDQDAQLASSSSDGQSIEGASRYAVNEKVADSRDVKVLEKEFKLNERILSMWACSNGLNTVEDWAVDYQKHPAGWAALLMIHGTSEISARLRTKVDSFAIYSALFLSMSIACLQQPPSEIIEDHGDVMGSEEWWYLHIRKRTYVYGFAIGTALHSLSIFLAMAFGNALNETARDSDVFRIFQKGQGFLATVKCETAFQLGCAADYIAVMACVMSVLPWWEVVLFSVILVAAMGWVFVPTRNLLFSNGAIVEYWRAGEPESNDPYDLATPVACFKARARIEQQLKGAGAAMEQKWNALSRKSRSPESP